MSPPTSRLSAACVCALALQAGIVLILPWAAAARRLGLEGWLSIGAFVAVVAVGWHYALRRGGLGGA